jgi:hypothetical protein
MTKQLLRRGAKFKLVVTLIHFPIGVIWGPGYGDLVGARVGATIGALGRFIGGLVGLFGGVLMGGLVGLFGGAVTGGLAGVFVKDLIGDAVVCSRSGNSIGDWMGDLVRDVMGANAGALVDERNDGTTNAGGVGRVALFGGGGMEGTTAARGE